jgi:hypothetical protein
VKDTRKQTWRQVLWLVPVLLLAPLMNALTGRFPILWWGLLLLLVVGVVSGVAKRAKGSTTSQPQSVSMDGLFVVRLYDGIHKEWIDISPPLPYAEAGAIWLGRTENGTKNTKVDDIGYYVIHPVDTRMIDMDRLKPGDHK